MPFLVLDEVPIGYQTSFDGELTIEISKANGILLNQPTFLFDKKMNTFHNLKQMPYTFTTIKGTYDDRFKLVYTDKTLDIQDFEKEAVLIYSKNGIVHLQSSSIPIKEIQIFDLLGRMVFNYSKYNDIKIAIKEQKIPNNQLLVVKVKLVNNSIIIKKIVL